MHRTYVRRRATVAAVGMAAVLALAGCSSAGAPVSSSDGRPLIGIIVKENSATYFVKMQQAAQQEAAKQGLALQTYAGKNLGDHQSQVQAVENLISAGAKGILITPADPKAILPSIEKAKAAGISVIALDTETDPPSAVDATFATDNFKAGVLIGRWAKAKFDKTGKQPRIGLLDFSADQVTTDVQRDQGFLSGFGIDIKDPDKIGDENDPRIAGHALSQGAPDGGRTAMENLLQKDPSINLVYTINESAATGAIEAIKAANKQNDITLVSIDGSCVGAEAMKAGQLAATSQQSPTKMAELGVGALAKYLKDGIEPSNPPGQKFTDTGTTLITNDPQPGIESEDVAYAAANCF